MLEAERERERDLERFAETRSFQRVSEDLALTTAVVKDLSVKEGEFLGVAGAVAFCGGGDEGGGVERDG